MNVETGEIRAMNEIPADEMHKWEEVGNRATKRQIENNRVSPYDNRSPLGKSFTKSRKKAKARAKISKNSRRKNRK